MFYHKFMILQQCLLPILLSIFGGNNHRWISRGTLLMFCDTNTMTSSIAFHVKLTCVSYPSYSLSIPLAKGKWWCFVKVTWSYNHEVTSRSLKVSVINFIVAPSRSRCSNLVTIPLAIKKLKPPLKAKWS